MNPAFGPAQVRELTAVFVECANALRDCWTAELQRAGGAAAELDALAWLGRATLDIIGRAGFGYEFGALAGGTNELNAAFATLFTPSANHRLLGFLQGMFPPLRLIVSPPRACPGARTWEC